MVWLNKSKTDSKFDTPKVKNLLITSREDEFQSPCNSQYDLVLRIFRHNKNNGIMIAG